MKRTTLVTCLFMATVAATLKGQGFMNLNFEDAKIVFGSGGLAMSNALPGWSAFSGTNQLTTIDYNNFAVPFPAGLVGSNSLVIDGNFSAALDGFSISQTGLVPSSTESLLFDGDSSLLVSLGGVNLSYSVVGIGTNTYGRSYDIYAANVSAFAGQVETLTFSSSYRSILDDIQFSPGAIPEPSSALLLFLGSGVLLYVCKRRRLCGADQRGFSGQ